MKDRTPRLKEPTPTEERLTKAEVEALRQDAKEASALGRKLFKANPLR